ncbi:MAG: hypothetical protein HFE39_03455 [Clostridiales bacterium]|nr:hypothetical protein [Clostridiales bacterium]
MARDRYLWNSGEDTIHDKRLEKTITTKKQKRENFWFYHKWHVIVSLCCLVLVALFLFDMFNKEVADYEIAILTQTATFDEDRAKIKATAESVAEDLNGDGKVLVTVNEYLINGNSEKDMAYIARLTNDLSNYQSMIFIVDDNNLTNYQQQNPGLFAYADGATPPEDAVDFDQIGIRWKDCSLLNSIDMNMEFDLQGGGTQSVDTQKMYQNMRVCIRSKAFDAGQNPDLEKRYGANQTLYQKLTGQDK